LSKYNSLAPEKFRPTNVSSLSRVLLETKFEHSPDCIADDIYDFSGTTKSSLTSTTSKYKGASISDVIRGNLIDEYDAEHQGTHPASHSTSYSSSDQELQPKNSLDEDEDKLFQQMTSHRRKKSQALPLQPLSSSCDGPSHSTRGSFRSKPGSNGKSIDSALSTISDSQSTPSPSSRPDILSTSDSSDEIIYSKRPTPPPSVPPPNRRYGRPAPPSSCSSSSIPNSLSLTSIEFTSPNDQTNQPSFAPTVSKPRPLCGRKYSMAPKKRASVGNEETFLEDSLETFSIPKVDEKNNYSSLPSNGTGPSTQLSTQDRKVMISGISRQAMRYLLLQANKKRKKRGKSSTLFTPKFETIPEESILQTFVMSSSNIRVENAFTLSPNIPSEYVSWMIDEYMKEEEEESGQGGNDENDVPKNKDSERSDEAPGEEGHGDDERKLLFQAIRNYNTMVLKEILNRNPDCVSYRDERGNTPLILATIVGWRKAIKLFIKTGADLDCRNHKGNTSCHYAFILPNYGDIQRYFYRKKANLFLVNERGYTCKYHRLSNTAVGS
jgi:hypothetical protein